MRPIVLFELTWRKIKRLMALAVKVALLLVVTYMVMGFVTAIILGFGVFLVVRLVFDVMSAD